MCYFASQKNRKMEKKNFKYLGLALIMIGAFALILGFLTGYGDRNMLQISALSLIVIGIPVHIIMTKRSNS